LLPVLAAACEQLAALLTQQQQQQQQQAQPSAVLAKLLTPTAAYQLLDLWCQLTKFCPWSTFIRGQFTVLPAMPHSFAPVGKLAAAAARSVVSGAAAAAAEAAGSSSSSGGGGKACRLAATAADLMGMVLAAAVDMSSSFGNEYEQCCLPPVEGQWADG
jgi:hypothetical protein